MEQMIHLIEINILLKSEHKIIYFELHDTHGINSKSD